MKDSVLNAWGGRAGCGRFQMELKNSPRGCGPVSGESPRTGDVMVVVVEVIVSLK